MSRSEPLDLRSTAQWELIAAGTPTCRACQTERGFAFPFFLAESRKLGAGDLLGAVPPGSACFQVGSVDPGWPALTQQQLLPPSDPHPNGNMRHTDPLEILKIYWGYPGFISKQESVVESILKGTDTLAVLPTGSGKSLCYQLSTLMMDGLCLVVSPLIALIRDQIHHLTSKKIKALSLTSELNMRQSESILEKCLSEDFKFLYVTPEKLQSEVFKESISSIDVCLMAVDEAHCISQWGYDFRPSYLKISSIRPFIGKCPTLALTATATQDDVVEIVENLQLVKPKIIKSSLRRPSLALRFVPFENKVGKTVEVLQSLPGRKIVYVRTRKSTQLLAEKLRKADLPAFHFHGALPQEAKDKVLGKWYDHDGTIMVCTSAFGMGVHQPGVPVVLHYDPPFSIEAYYQESGRAGRNDQPGYSVVLDDAQDRADLRAFMKNTLLDIEDITKVYDRLALKFQIPVGNTSDPEPLDIRSFAIEYHLAPLKTYYAMLYLENLGFIHLRRSPSHLSTLRIVVSRKELYQLQVVSRDLDAVVKALLRKYGGGLYSQALEISENVIASQINRGSYHVQSVLRKLHRQGVAIYQTPGKSQRVQFITPRVPMGADSLNPQHLSKRNEAILKKSDAVIRFMENSSLCRSFQISMYFGEMKEYRCGKCDVCSRSPVTRTPG